MLLPGGAGGAAGLIFGGHGSGVELREQPSVFGHRSRREWRKQLWSDIFSKLLIGKWSNK